MRMKNHFSKMGKVLLSAALLSTVGITSCSDDDFHLKDYEDNAPTFLGQSIYHELARRGNFQTVVKLIDDLEYAEVLSKTGSKTMFVAPDSAWEKFFQNNSWGVSSYEEAHVYTEDIETPQFEPFNSDLFTEKIAETANKTAQVSHDLEMKRIKAKLIADLCKELVKTPIRYEDVPQRAREIADKAFENL